MIVGELDQDSVKTKFIPLDNREFKQIELDLDGVLDENDLVYKINELVQNDIEKSKNELKNSKENVTSNYDFSYIDEDTYTIMYEVYLTGNRTFEINLKRINSLVDNEQILKIKDKTQMNIDLDSIAKENTLRGLFVQKVLDKQGEYSKEEIEKALELGLESMK